MGRNVMLGSYVAADTPVHRLDARVKLVLLLALTVALFMTGSPAVMAAIAVVVIAAARCGGVGAKALLSAVRPTAVILAFSLLANSFVLDGTGDVALVGTLGVTTAGAARGLFAVGRIVVLVGASFVVTSTTPSTAIADALSSLAAPLGRVGVPTGDIAMIVSVALRFIPLTAEELLRIRDAQRARGVDFSSGSVPVRVRRWMSVLTPLVVALFRRADDLASAMRERCYRGKGRTRLVSPLGRLDVLVLVVGLALCVVASVL